MYLSLTFCIWVLTYIVNIVLYSSITGSLDISSETCRAWCILHAEENILKAQLDHNNLTVGTLFSRHSFYTWLSALTKESIEKNPYWGSACHYHTLAHEPTSHKDQTRLFHPRHLSWSLDLHLTLNQKACLQILPLLPIEWLWSAE